MSKFAPPVIIDYYTDILCVWAWIAQPRLEELETQWGDKVSVKFRYIDIFGDALTKIPAQWGEQDGYERFQHHVVTSADEFEHAPVHPDIWTRVRPNSSILPHLVLKAIGLTEGEKAHIRMAKELRVQFFTQATNISLLNPLLEICAEAGLNVAAIQAALDNGTAMAALSRDARRAADMGIKGSPTWVLNEGRQTLYGNLGYRILNANIEELIKNPQDELSWC